MKFYGAVGYGQNVESTPGVWADEITEVTYLGDVVRNTRRLVDGTKVNDDLTVGNLISIVADAYALENFFAIRYVVWNNIRWVVSNVEVQSPRLLLTLGVVYNGPIPG